MRRAVSLLLAVVAGAGFLPASAPSQGAADSASAYVAVAESLLALRTGKDTLGAIFVFEQAAAIYRRAGQDGLAGGLLARVGVVQRGVGRLDSALIYLRASLAIRRALGQRRDQSIVLNDIGSVLRRLKQPDSALAAYHEALALARAIHEYEGQRVTLGNLSNVYWDVNQPDSAVAALGGALVAARASGDPTSLYKSLERLGDAHYQVGHPDSAIVYLREALAVRRALGHRKEGRNPLRAQGVTSEVISAELLPVQAYHRQALGIGNLYWSLGQADSALWYYREAFAVGDAREQARALNQIGLVFAQLGRPDSATANYSQALDIRRMIGDRKGQVESLNNAGMVYWRVDELDKALEFYQAALTVASEDSGIAVSSILHNLGLVFAEQDLPDSALAYFYRALAHVRREGGRDEGSTLVEIGFIYMSRHQADSAQSNFMRALPLVRAANDHESERAVLLDLAHLYGRYLTPPDRARSAAYFDSAAALYANVRQRAGGDENSRVFAEQLLGTFTTWPFVWLGRAGEVGDSVSMRAALGATERLHAQALQDFVLSTRRATGGPPASRPTLSPGGDLADEANRSLAQLRRLQFAALSYLVSRDTLVIWLALPSGAVRLLRQPVGSERLEELVAAVRSSVWADSARRRIPEAEQRDNPALPRSAAVNALVKKGRDSVLASLAAVLVPGDLQRQLPTGVELVIVPQGVLGLVPFAALPSDSAGVPLGIRHPIRYAPSLATLALIEETPSVLTGGTRRRALSPALIVGNPKMPRDPDRPGGPSLPPLLQSGLEGRWLAATLGTPLLTGASASESAVRARLPGAALVHLATHGRAYDLERNVPASFVALAPDRANDGLLTVGELMSDERLQLRAELVVLSACQTGLGNLSQAEGTIGLQRALLARGARSVLVSLWSVRDDATRILMERFYSYWLDDTHPVNKAEALRHAQADVRALPQFKAPYFWAGFQLVGAR